MTARNKFIQQLKIVKHAYTNNSIILGDSNLDYSKKFDQNFAHGVLFEDFDESLSNYNLVQIVNFSTWSRLVRNVRKTSILDHIYI